MVEARALAMGQYGHNNQPVHHVLWLLMMLGADSRKVGETSIRRVMQKAYGTDYFAGDEDNGENSTVPLAIEGVERHKYPRFQSFKNSLFITGRISTLFLL